jgi:hypothetical protein
MPCANVRTWFEISRASRHGRVHASIKPDHDAKHRSL